MFDMQQGIICGITGKIADFEESCPNYEGDPAKLELVAKQEKVKKADGQIANKGLRFLNYLLDYIFVLVFVYVFGFYIGLLLGMYAPEVLDTFDFENTWFNMLFNIIAGLVYYSILEFTTGRTLAKFITCTKVVTTEGDAPSFATILKRSLARYIPFEPFSFLMNDKSGWHDTMSDTMVISDNPYKKKVKKESLESRTESLEPRA
ncbi:MAG: hypothetical protein CMP59_10135 [Flavobacteriales bacterium]|nr:hypothetical protein [Flavobacteriales bacterium]